MYMYMYCTYEALLKDKCIQRSVFPNPFYLFVRGYVSMYTCTVQYTYEWSIYNIYLYASVQCIYLHQRINHRG
jgi:hypothetical protein